MFKSTTLLFLTMFFMTYIAKGQMSTMTVSDQGCNVYEGLEAGHGGVGEYNTSYGCYAGWSVVASSKNNTFLGAAAGKLTASGSRNTYVGMSAAYGNSTGSDNVSVGYLSSQSVGNGSNNTYLGAYSAYTSTGSNNVFIGYRTGYYETSSNKLYIDNSDTPTPLIYGDFASDRVAVNGALNVGGGTPIKWANGYKLSVAGSAIAEEMVVELQPAWPWPDFVFEENYKMPSFSELEKYIREHKHLPGVPTAAEVKEQGINLGEMNVILLQKVEELTLELIRLEKRVQELEGEKK